ncbi:hypothetical protein QOZ80_2BG0180650 [Eleusine coracana subsp. coracana]|nr:hypothetical protein QOZ80_2BG0180650 [Eleusine coracana subsp. coracana]
MASSSILPDWALLDRYIFWRDDDSFPANDPTEASSTNSRGDEIRVCFQLHDPPRPSRLYLWWPGGTDECVRFSVVGAHHDAVLLQMAYSIPVPNSECLYDMYDYFIYRTSGGSPSLIRLPSIDGTIEEFRALFENGSFRHTNQQLRRIEGLDCWNRGSTDDHKNIRDSSFAERQNIRISANMDIAVIRRGTEDVTVAELQTVRTQEPELHVIFPSATASSQWVVKKPRIIFHGPDLDLKNLLWLWSSDAIVR